MRSLFDVGLRLVGAAVLCWAIEPISNLAMVLSLSTIPRSGQMMLIHTLVSTALYLLVGLSLLFFPGLLSRLVPVREATSEPQELLPARSVLQVGLMLIGLFYLIPAIKDLSLGITEIVRPAVTQVARATGREFVRGFVGAIVSILLIIRSRQLAMWGMAGTSASATSSAPSSGSSQRQRR